MPAPKPLPASVRYFRAQLKLWLSRPLVWGSGLVFLLSLVVLTEYWRNPSWFTAFTAGSAPESQPTGRSPIVRSPANPPANVRGGLPAPRSLPTSNLLPATPLPVPGALPSPTASTTNLLPASGSIGTAAMPSPLSGVGASLGLPETRSVGEGQRSGMAQPANPLQSALDRNSPLGTGDPANLDPANLNNSEPNNPDSVASDLPIELRSAPVSNFAAPESQFANPTSRFVPRTSPAPGTTGYTLPSSLTTPNASGTGRSFDTGSFGAGSNNNGVQLQPVPGQSAGFAAPPSPRSLQPRMVQPQVVQPSPFSVRRTPPGQSIGGGEINTFSNP